MGSASTGAGKAYNSSHQRSRHAYANNYGNNNNESGDTPERDEQPVDPQGGRKRVLPPPSSPLDVLEALVLTTARAYIYVPTVTRALAYMLVVLVGAVCGNMTLPEFYFMQKHNLFNQLFAKWSLAWTLALLGPFVYLTARVYSGDTQRNVRQQLARLIVAVFVWYACTALFDRIQAATASCSLPRHSASRRACLANAGEWAHGHDISGHTFLLVYLCLLIVEEAKVMRNWDNMAVMLDRPDDAAELMHLTAGKADASRALHKELTPMIKRIFLALTVLTLLWEVQLVITLLYYHTMMHKILGGAAALLCWATTYRTWYTLPMSPGMPGHGPLAYSNWRRPK